MINWTSAKSVQLCENHLIRARDIEFVWPVPEGWTTSRSRNTPPSQPGLLPDAVVKSDCLRYWCITAESSSQPVSSSRIDDTERIDPSIPEGERTRDLHSVTVETRVMGMDLCPRTKSDPWRVRRILSRREEIRITT